MLGVVLALAVVFAYAALFSAGPLSWDDDRNIWQNPFVVSGDWWKAWSAPYFGLYVPVTSTVWTWLYQLGHGATWPFRVYNLALHVLNTVLVWQLIRAAVRFARRTDDSARVDAAARLGAAVFALHPLQVGAVAWISGGRDLTATALGLAAALVYLSERRGRFILSTILFALGLLAKPSIAGVPLALCVLSLVRDRVLIVRTAREMAVWMAMVAAVAIATSSVQSGMAPIHVDWWWRPIVALDALGFYAERVVAPVHLAADYGRTPGALGAHPGWLVMTLGPSLLVLAIVFIELRKRRLSWALAGVGLLAPVLGILTFAYQRISTVADHYMYLPMLAVAGGIATLVSLWSPTRQVIAAATLVVTFVGAGLTWQRARVWQTDAGFFGNMLERNPVSVSALANLSKAECEAGRLEGGAHYAQRALELDPTNVAALVNSAYCDFHQALYDNVLALRHRLSDPNVQYALDRDDWGTSRLLNTMAGANFNQGHMLSGWADLCQAMALDPDNGDLRANATDVAKQVAVLGEHLTCPGRLSWKTFLSNEVKP